MKNRKIAGKKKFQQPQPAISSLSAKVDNGILTATKKLVLLSNGQYRLGNRVFTPGQGYTIKSVDSTIYFVVWDYDKERTRISKGTAEQLINLAKSSSGKRFK